MEQKILNYIFSLLLKNNNSQIKENYENVDKNSSNNDNIIISNSNSIIENNSLDIENFEVEYPQTKTQEEKRVEEKNQNYIIQNINKKDEIKKPIIHIKKKNYNIVFKNIINKNNKLNNINNININTIKAHNIIIINNNIINSTNKKTKIKKNELKEPEDAKIPKDRKTKKKYSYNKKKKSEEQSINSININNLLIKEAFLNTESQKDNYNMESFKYINQKEEKHNKKNQEKSKTDAEQYNLIISNKKGTNYLKLPNGKISKEKIKNIVFII